MLTANTRAPTFMVLSPPLIITSIKQENMDILLLLMNFKWPINVFRISLRMKDLATWYSKLTEVAKAKQK